MINTFILDVLQDLFLKELKAYKPQPVVRKKKSVEYKCVLIMKFVDYH